MRIYLPATLSVVAALVHTGEIVPAPVRGYAVTPALREWYSSGDLEELEYVALTQAARESLRLLAADPDTPRRRVVLAVEAGEGVAAARGGFAEPALVEITAPVLLRDIRAGHVDDLTAAREIGAAVAALAAADAGDEDAQFVVDGAEGAELQWYATQELADLAAGS
ncbi:MAG TPA: hypothetical protein VGI58_11705 [Streptosporangiaceae bacterium]